MHPEQLRLLRRLLMSLALGLWAAEARALHIDIAVSLSNGRLMTDFCLPDTDGCDRLEVLETLGFTGTTLPVDLNTGQQIFVTDFGDLDGGPFRVDDPGFISGVGLLPANLLLRYQAVGQLEYWDPATEAWTNQVAQDARIRLAGGLSEETAISTDPTVCGGLPFCTVSEFVDSSTTFTGAGIVGPETLIIDRTDSSGTLHTHLDWRLERATGGLGGAAGAYMLQLALAADGYTTSTPLYIMFNRGLSNEAFALALASRILLSEVDLADEEGAISGTVVFGDDNSSGQASAPLAGSGSLIKRGSGQLLLPGTSTYTGATQIDAGELQADIDNRARLELAAAGLLTTHTSSIGSLSGTGQVSVANALTLGLDQGNSSFSGNITGAGQLQKQGQGIFTLNGIASMSAGVLVQEGEIRVNGLVAAPLTVMNGARLGGVGSITGLAEVQAGGLLAPGNSIGTLNVADLTLLPGSLFEVEVNAAGAADRVQASGTVTVAGARLQVLAEGGIYAPSTDYTVIEAAGGVNGTFADVTSNLAYLSPSLSYTSTTVLLRLVRNNLGFLLPGQTTNQAASANALASVQDDPDLEPLVTRILGQSAEAANATFDALSAPIYGLTSLAVREADISLGQQIKDRLWSGFRPATGTQLGVAAGDELGDRPRVRFWVDALGSGGARTNQGGALGFDYYADGLMAGGDVRLGRNTRLGAAFGYRRLSVESNDLNETTRGELPSVAVSAQRVWGPLEWRAVFGVSMTSLEFERQVLGETYTASGEVLHGFLSQELAAALRFGLSPYLGLHLLEQSSLEVSEAGSGVAALFTELPAVHTQTLELGLRHRYASESIIVETEIGWRQQLNAVAVDTASRFERAPEGRFTTTSVAPGRSAWSFGLGLESDPSAEVQVQGRAKVIARDGEDLDYVLSAGLRLQW